MFPRGVGRRRRGSDASDASDSGASDNSTDQAANGHNPLRIRAERQRLVSRGNDSDSVPDRPSAPDPDDSAARGLRLNAFDSILTRQLGPTRPIEQASSPDRVLMNLNQPELLPDRGMMRLNLEIPSGHVSSAGNGDRHPHGEGAAPNANTRMMNQERDMYAQIRNVPAPDQGGRRTQVEVHRDRNGSQYERGEGDWDRDGSQYEHEDRSRSNGDYPYNPER